MGKERNIMKWEKHKDEWGEEEWMLWDGGYEKGVVRKDGASSYTAHRWNGSSNDFSSLTSAKRWLENQP